MNRYFIPLTTVFALACNLNFSAHAVPGESVQAVTTWVKQHSLLSPLKRGIGELSGQPFYTSEAKLPNGTVVFSMNPDRRDKISQRETIALETAQPSAGFTRENLGVIQQIYTGAIANDFRDSRYVAKVDYNSLENRYFRGKQFAYQTVSFKQANNGKKFYHFTVIPLKDLDSILQSDRQCRSRSAFGCE